MSGKVIKVPKSVDQSGIVKDATNNYKTRPWASGTGQAAVSKLWKKRGSEHTRGIATISGNYLVAVSGVFGKAGDGIVINLSGGIRIPAIIADIKGSDKANKWGHDFGGKTSLVEWEAYTVYQKIKLGSWEGKKVKSIINFGKYSGNKKVTEGIESGVDKYLKVARSALGPGGKEWVKKTADSFHPGAWCADTQCAFAIKTKFAGKIMPRNKSMAGAFGQAIVEKYGGKYIKGPGYNGGRKVVPEPGDIVEHRGKGKKYSSAHVGVVEKVKNGTVTSIDGNYNDKVSRRSFSTSDKSISWYARPDWDKVGGSGTYDDDDEGDGGGLLYDTLSTRADATIRDVCYADKDGSPSKKKERYRLSVLNYTSALFWMIYILGGTENEGEEGEEGEGEASFPSWMNKNSRYVFEFLSDKGLNKAAICGILGNMSKENTNFKPGLFNGVNHYGICQWSSGRYGNTKHTIAAECKLLWKELNNGYKGVLKALKKVKNTKSGAESAAEIFCKQFERPGNYSKEVPERQKRAIKYFNGIEVGVSKKGWHMPYAKGCKYYGNKDGDFMAKRSYENHPGIDMTNPTKPNILAINGGKVIRASYFGGYGNCVDIQHSGGYWSRYGHGSKLLVKKGDKVNSGQKIMVAGSTGHSYGVHLHLELHKKNKLISPRTFLPIPKYTSASFKQFTVK